MTVSCHTVTTGVAGTRRPTGQVRARHPVDTELHPPGEVAGIDAPDSRPAFDDGRPEVFIYHGRRAPAWICKAAYAASILVAASRHAAERGRAPRHRGRGSCSDPRRGPIVTMTTDSLRNVKDRFSEFIDRVEREHERVVVTRNGKPAAVLVSLEDLDSLEATLEVLGDSEAVRGLIEAEAAVAGGDVVRGVDAVKALRPSTSG